MPITTILAIQSLIQRGENLSIVGNGDGTLAASGPSVVVTPMQRKEIELRAVQFDKLFLDTLADYVDRNKARVFLNDGSGDLLLTSEDVRELRRRDLSEITGVVTPHDIVGPSHTASGLTPGSVLTALTPTTLGFATPAVLAEAFALVGGRNANTTNSYLRAAGNVPMNQSGEVLAFDATIVGIAAVASSSSSWVAEIRRNGSATVIASLTLAAVRKAWMSALSVDVDAGDELQFYCNGTGIPDPVIVLYLKRR